MGGRSGQSEGGSGGGAGSSSAEISAAVANYQSTNFDGINNELRYDKPDKYKDVISGMDKASTDVTSDKVYRGLGSDFTKEIANKHGVKDVSDINELKSKLIGKTITDKGYMSTTRDLKTAGDFARDKGTGKTTVMQISGKKKGIEVDKHVKNYRSRQENEFIIKRGTKVKITDVSISKTGKLVLYTEIVN